MYDPDYIRTFYDAYGTAEWLRLEATAYGRLQAIVHTDFIQRYLQPGDRVLDAGSGPGRFSSAVARMAGNVTLLDLSQRQLDLAREKLAESGLLESAEDFIQADVVDLSMFPPGHFDLVVCYGGALSYVCERREEAVAQLVRVTRPGGVLLVSVMSRFGAVANNVRRPIAPILRDPEGWYVWRVIQEGDLPGTPSRTVRMQHPPMHLYSRLKRGATEVVRWMRSAGSSRFQRDDL